MQSNFYRPFATAIRKQAVCRCSPSCENAFAALRRARQTRTINLLSSDNAQSNDDDRRQRRKQGGVVGAAASKTQVPPKARSGCWVPQPGRSGAHSKSSHAERKRTAAHNTQQSFSSSFLGHHGIEPAHQFHSHLFQPGLRLPRRLCGLRGQRLFWGTE